MITKHSVIEVDTSKASLKVEGILVGDNISIDMVNEYLLKIGNPNCVVIFKKDRLGIIPVYDKEEVNKYLIE